MAMHPLRFAKEHPLAVVTSMALGMVIGPWALSTAGNLTGVGLRLPTYGGNGG